MGIAEPGGMGGGEAIGRVAGLGPEVKVIVSSGYSNDPAMVDFREHGFSGAIAKPYGVNELSKAVHEVIGGSC